MGFKAINRERKYFRRNAMELYLMAKGEKRTLAVCTGCDKPSNECWPWSSPEAIQNLGYDVTSDQTYMDGKFVCEGCYAELKEMGLKLTVQLPSNIQHLAFMNRIKKAQEVKDKDL